MKPFIIQSRLTERDYLQMMFRFNFSIRRIRLLVLVSAMLSVFALIHLTGIQRLSDSDYVWYAWPFLLLLIPFNIYRSSRRLYRHSHLNEIESYSFDQEGFSVNAKTRKGRVRWEDIRLVKQMGKFVLFYHGNQSAHIILKSDFSNNQLEALWDFLKKQKIHTEQ
ncbi:MAG: YcxB family protein [Cytophagales bacterium]|nr:YcxB family protein [Cytophagales bacterium]